MSLVFIKRVWLALRLRVEAFRKVSSRGAARHFQQKNTSYFLQADIAHQALMASPKLVVPGQRTRNGGDGLPWQNRVRSSRTESTASNAGRWSRQPPGIIISWLPASH